MPLVRLLEQVHWHHLLNVSQYCIPWLEALTFKKFLLRSSLPFLTFTFKLSAVTLVTGTLSLAFSNHV